ncbi:hypothetical protein HG442_002875 [Candidatus Gracilibacteria bacterium]|nr:hypothetical protein [Candidatus Gracilibacteria bacterium]
MTNTLIIPSAGEPQNALFPGVYDLMIPINGKPTINYIFENISLWKIQKVVILLNKKDIATRNYINFLKIENVESQSLGETIFCAKKYIGENENVIIQLGDTILNAQLDFSHDFISVSNKKLLNPEDWTFVNGKFEFFDKIENFDEKDFYLVNGIYFLKNPDNFFDELERNKNFYNALEKYFKNNSGILLNHNDGYYDLGHLDEYYKSKIDFLRVRSFNSLEYDDFRGIITKKSSNKEKLLWEINWFKNLPSDLKNFTPRLVDYNEGEDVTYSLEFYGYSSLADIFLYSKYSDSYLKNILSKLINYISYLKSNYNDKNYSIKNFYDIYLDKTFVRISDLLKNPILKNIYDLDFLEINGKKYKNIKDIISEKGLQKIVNEKLYKTEDCTIIHGDLCFSNILFDVYNGIFKLIDPRGKFGELGIWGDIKYDIAKLRHSVHGKYENIISDLFNLNYSIDTKKFEFEYFNGETKNIINFFDGEVQKLGYDINTIKYIEALLYLTMIPLHSDSLNRQIVMYLTATILFNETIELGK